MSNQEIIDKIKEAGVVGMGGAGFPTHVKLSPKEPDKIEYIIANCAECEPYLTSDYRRMVEQPEKLVEGMKIILQLFPNAKGIFGIEDNKPDAVANMTKEASGTDIEVVALPAKYPQGGEKQLIYALTKRRVPNGGLPADAGVVVTNVSTAAAIATAVYEGKPLIDRVVTVTGMVKNPANIRARIGTPLSALVEECGGFEEGVRKIVLGGPMMGPTITSLNIPVIKGTGGLLALGEESVHAKEAPCIHCGRCVAACPMRLVPTQLDAFARRSRWSDAEKGGAMNCLECGACTFACPSKRELTQSCRMAKAAIAARRKKS